MNTRKKTLPKPTGKHYRSVAAMAADLAGGGKRGAAVARSIRNSARRDRYKAKKLGITLLELWQREDRG